MTRTLLVASFTSLLILASAHIDVATAAGPISVQTSLVDPVLVGTSSGALVLVKPSATPGFNVQVNDASNAGVPSTVSLYFANSPSIHFDANQNPGITMDCLGRLLSKPTDANGHVTFGARFGGYDNQSRVVVFADDGKGGGPVFLRLIPARSVDIDGVGASTSLPDWSLFASAYVLAATVGCNAAGHQECDFDNDNCLGLHDFATFAGEFFSPGGVYCQ